VFFHQKAFLGLILIKNRFNVNLIKKMILNKEKESGVN